MITHKLIEASIDWKEGSGLYCFLPGDLRKPIDKYDPTVMKNHGPEPSGLLTANLKYIRTIGRHVKWLGDMPKEKDGKDHVDLVYHQSAESCAFAYGCLEFQHSLAAVALYSMHFDFGHEDDLPAIDDFTTNCLVLPYPNVFIQLSTAQENLPFFAVVMEDITRSINDVSDDINVGKMLPGRNYGKYGNDDERQITVYSWIAMKNSSSETVYCFNPMGALIQWDSERSRPQISPFMPDVQMPVFPGEPSEQVRMFDTQEKAVELMASAAVAVGAKVIGCLEVLNAQGVGTVIHEAPEKLNKKRIKRGKPPIRQYHTLDIFAPGKKTNGRYQLITENEKGTRRPHLRRGHIRRYRSEYFVNMQGQTKYIRPQWVGKKPTEVIPDKEYKVHVDKSRIKL